MFVVANNLCTTIIWCIVQVWYGVYSNIIFKYIYRPCKSLLTPVLENVPKWMYRNGTYNVRSVYRSCTPICTEVVRTMYRNGHVPNWSYPRYNTLLLCTLVVFVLVCCEVIMNEPVPALPANTARIPALSLGAL